MCRSLCQGQATCLQAAPVTLQTRHPAPDLAAPTAPLPTPQTSRGVLPKFPLHQSLPGHLPDNCNPSILYLHLLYLLALFSTYQSTHFYFLYLVLLLPPLDYKALGDGRPFSSALFAAASSGLKQRLAQPDRQLVTLAGKKEETRKGGSSACKGPAQAPRRCTSAKGLISRGSLCSRRAHGQARGGSVHRLHFRSAGASGSGHRTPTFPAALQSQSLASGEGGSGGKSAPLLWAPK